MRELIEIQIENIDLQIQLLLKYQSKIEYMLHAIIDSNPELQKKWEEYEEIWNKMNEEE